MTKFELEPIYRHVARDLICRFGSDAHTIAARAAADFTQRGDTVGATMWMSIQSAMGLDMGHVATGGAGLH